jgi:hypothetical protein
MVYRDMARSCTTQTILESEVPVDIELILRLCRRQTDCIPDVEAGPEVRNSKAECWD